MQSLGSSGCSPSAAQLQLPLTIPLEREVGDSKAPAWGAGPESCWPWEMEMSIGVAVAPSAIPSSGNYSASHRLR